jgi:hypothetical protein
MWNKKQEKLFATYFMRPATSSKRQQPKFMAVKTEKKKSELIVANKKKKRKINKRILATWIAVVVFTILFWYLIIKLFI